MTPLDLAATFSAVSETITSISTLITKYLTVIYAEKLLKIKLVNPGPLITYGLSFNNYLLMFSGFITILLAFILLPSEK
jgi:hypothetical protein